MLKLADNYFFPLENIKVLGETDDNQRPLANCHVHNYWEIKVFPQGNSNNAPMVIMMPPNVVHAITFNIFSREGTFVVAFRQPKSFLQIFTASKRQQDMFLGFSYLDDLCPGGVVAFMDKIRVLRNSDMEAENQVRILNHLLHAMFAVIEAVAETDKGIGLSKFERACDLIEREYYEGDLTVERIAAYVKVTPGHLANLFKNKAAGTVRQYLIAVRLKHAMRLLKTGCYTVKDVAQLTGWNNQFYFSNSFRKHYKISPSTVPFDTDTKMIS